MNLLTSRQFLAISGVGARTIRIFVDGQSGLQLLLIQSPKTSSSEVGVKESSDIPDAMETPGKAPAKRSNHKQPDDFQQAHRDSTQASHTRTQLTTRTENEV